MPVNSQSIGKDITFTVVTADGVLTMNGKTTYDAKPMYTDIKHKDLNGETTYGYIPDGWQIAVTIERRDPIVDKYFAQQEANFYAGINILPGTILENTRETDGSITTFRYTNVALKYDNAGSWKSDSLITISLTGMATRRELV